MGHVRLKNNQKKSNVSHGGNRSGAGRKQGVRNRRTQALIQKVAEEGKLPLDIMLEAMREAFRAGGAIQAFPFAVVVAPYLHPKLVGMQAKVHSKSDLQDLLESMQSNPSFLRPVRCISEADSGTV
jgi:hypothetical protein